MARGISRAIGMTVEFVLRVAVPAAARVIAEFD